jgi:hypothetical protein
MPGKLVELGVMTAVPSFIATSALAVITVDVADMEATTGVAVGPPQASAVTALVNQLEKLDSSTQVKNLVKLFFKKPYLAAMARLELRSRKQKDMAKKGRQRYMEAKKKFDKKYDGSSATTTAPSSCSGASSCSREAPPSCSGASSCGVDVEDLVFLAKRDDDSSSPGVADSDDSSDDDFEMHPELSPLGEFDSDNF